jgi:hypothetical protein
LAVLSLNLAAWAQVIERSQTGAEETIDCQGRAFKVEGTDNHFTLLGECPELLIDGTGNVIMVERVGTIRVKGVDNKIFWSEALGGRTPENFIEGVDNKVTQERMEPTRGERHHDHFDQRHAEGEDRRASADAPDSRGGAVMVNNGQAAVKVEGGPRGGAVSVETAQGAVKVEGGPRGGAVSVETAQGAVRVENGPHGGAVSVETAQGTVNVGVGGHEHRATQAEEAAETEDPESINISGSDLARTVTCHGEDVMVSGNHNRVRLRGECGEVTVSGSANDVQVESASAISVVGNDNTVTWEHALEGNKPQISKSGHGNKIKQARSQGHSRPN